MGEPRFPPLEIQFSFSRRVHLRGLSRDEFPRSQRSNFELGVARTVHKMARTAWMNEMEVEDQATATTEAAGAAPFGLEVSLRAIQVRTWFRRALGC